jgi:hypothetical protein
MREYDIKSLETGTILGTVVADKFEVNESGVVKFIQHGGFPASLLVATTQVSSSTLIVERIAPKPALVVPITEG